MGFIDKTKKEIEKKGKKEIKKIIWKVLLKILPYLLVFMLLLGLIGVWDAVCEEIKSMFDQVVAYKTSLVKKLTDDYWMDLSEKIQFGENQEERTLVDQYIYNLSNLGISLKDLNLLGEADYEEPNLLTDPENKAKVQKYIKSFVVSELITTQIHRRNGNGLTKVEEDNPIVKAILGPMMSTTAANLAADADLQITADKVDGGIYLYRTKDKSKETGNEETEYNLDDEEMYYRMEYKTVEDFNNMIEKFNDSDNPNIENMESVFAIDEDDNLLIAQINGYTKVEKTDGEVTSTENSYTATVKKIDYKQKVAEFGLPYEFLVDLCMVTQNPEYVFHVAQMALDTRIDILLINNETTQITERERQKTKHHDDGTTSTYTLTTIKTEKSTNPVLELKYANSWSKYQKVIWTNKVDESTKVTSTETSTTTKTKITNTYSSIEGSIIRKSDNFLGLLRNSTGRYISGTTPSFKVEGSKFDRYGKNVEYKLPNLSTYEAPLNNLISGEEAFYELLRKNERTEPLVELIQYYLTFPEQEYYELDESEIKEILGGYNQAVENHYVGSDYIVKTDEPGALKPVTKQELVSIINSSFSGNQKENALSIVDTLIECQDKYKVNAVFVLAFARQESSVGTANTSHVKKNNWLSWNLGKTYSSPQENIETVMRNMANGSIYFSKGKYTISEIGHTYCPNDPPKYPTQGDDWVKKVTGYVKDMYSNIGFEVEETVNKDISNKIVKQAAECMQYLVDNEFKYEYGGTPSYSIYGKKKGTLDCSGYVSWVLYELGYLDGRWNSATFANNPKGWKKITSKENVKAGDIVVYKGHVEICAEDVKGDASKLTKYNVGYTESIYKSPYTSNWHKDFICALRIIEE